jgi:hypothetical protein
METTHNDISADVIEMTPYLQPSHGAGLGPLPVISRVSEKLRRDLGPSILSLLEDDSVIEIMRNPDGHLWVERLGAGMSCIGTLPEHKAHALAATIAAMRGQILGDHRPVLECEMPDHACRFTAAIVRVRRMTSYSTPDLAGQAFLRDELVNFLHGCVTGLAEPINLPPIPMYLDALIGGQDLHTGDTPKIGDTWLCCVGIEGFPQHSFPCILGVLGTLPLACRWSTRLIFLDRHEALASLAQYRRKWKQRERGFAAQVFRTQGGIVNEDALLMTRETEHAMTDAQSALVTFLYMTSVIVLPLSCGRSREVPVP